MTYRPLADLLGSVPLPVDQALELAAAIAGAVGDRREIEAPHCIELDRVWIDRKDDGTLIAQLLDPPAARDSVCGLALADRICLAPELIASARADERADVYALGVILYLALTGRAPFDAADPVEALTLRLCGVVSPPSERGARVSADVDRLVLDLIAANVEQRPRLVAAAARVTGLLPARHEARSSEGPDDVVLLVRKTPPVPTAASEPPPASADPSGRRRVSPITAENRFFDESDALEQASDVVELPYQPPPRRRAIRRAAVIGAIGVAAAVVIVVTRSPTDEPRRATTVERPPAAEHASTARPAQPTPVAATAAPAARTTTETDVAVQRGRERAVAVDVPKRETIPAVTAVSHTPDRVPTAPIRETAEEIAPPIAPPAPDPDWLAEASRLQTAGDLGGAYRMYFRASKRSDRAIAASGCLGMAQIGLLLKRYTEAQRDARRAIELGGDTKRAWTVVATAACALGDASTAAAAHSQLGGGSCE